MEQARYYLIAVYLDYVNNYLTVELFAEHNGLTVDEANKLLDLARTINNHSHPEQ